MGVDGNVVLFEENVGTVYHARQYRRMLEAQWVGPGVIDAGDLLVSPSTPNGMSVDIAAGTCLVKATTGSDEGLYMVRNSAGILDLPIAASDATDARHDLIVCYVLDSEHDGGIVNNDVDHPPFVVLTGAPASSPVDPTVPDNCLVLARVIVAANATSVSAISADLRTWTPRTIQHRTNVTWTAHTVDFDLASVGFPATAVPYDTMLSTVATVELDYGDAVTWDLSFEIWTGTGGTGTLVGRVGRRNNGYRDTLVVVCDEILVPANTIQTFYPRFNYNTAGGTPTTGFTPATLGDNCIRGTTRPARF